jgi:hypothetical protein
MITNSASSVEINADINANDHYTLAFFGGITGYNDSSALIELASNTKIIAKVIGNEASLSYVGGIVGYNNKGSIDNVYAQGRLELEALFDKASVGGIFGGNVSTTSRMLHILDTQIVLLNNNLVDVNNPVHKTVLYTRIEDINAWNSTHRWGILG